jgi:hypothetical protein
MGRVRRMVEVGCPTLALAAAAALLGAVMTTGSASSMPLNGLTTVSANKVAEHVQPVVWVCGPFRCWWRPDYGPGWGPYPYRYWGPAYYCGAYYGRPCYGYRW